MDVVKSSSTVFDSLVADGLLSADQLQIGTIESSRSGEPIDKALLRLGFITEALLNCAIDTANPVTRFSRERKIPRMSLDTLVPDAEALAYVSADLARRLTVIPISSVARTLTVATTDPHDLPLQDRLKTQLPPDYALQLALASEHEIITAIDRFYGFELSIDGILHEIETGEVASTAAATGDDYHQPVVRLVDAILTDAVKHGASDIHFEPEAGFVRIRYRIDGVMQQIRCFHIDYWAAVVVRVKVMAELNIAENRAPQDGQLSMRLAGRVIEFRVSCMPTVHGENIVLRVLDRQSGIVPLDELGLAPASLQQIRVSMDRPEGLILVTGPTGSGKTTTLYSMLNHKSDDSINIMTLEDPVEYTMTLLRQTSVNEQVKLDFSSGIKSILRQDPDVILVGEIRDAQAAEMVFRASMTGHQVYSTLHANSAVGAIARLQDLGVSPALIAENVISIIGQRLVRKLCVHCKVEDRSQAEGADVCYAKGCEECRWQGYKGRAAFVEVLRITPELSELIIAGASLNRIIESARQDQFQTLADEALRHVRTGITSMTEASRVIDLTNSTRSVS